MAAHAVALVGAGYIADWHARALRGRRDTRVIGVCDLNAGRARALADQHGIPNVYTSVEALLAEGRPEVAHVLVPPEHHARCASQLLDAGVHLFLEKPMAVTAAECQALTDLARARNRALGVGHNFLFAPPYEALRADLRAHKLGQLDQVTIVWNKELGQIRGGPHGGWLFREPGNLMLEVGPHPIAHLLDLLGDPDDFTAEADRALVLPTGGVCERRWCVDGHCGPTRFSVRISFESAALEHFIHVRGTAGSATVDLERGTYVLDRPGDSGMDDYDRYRQVARVSQGLVQQARRQFRHYALSKFRLSRQGSLYGTSIARALAAFYEGLPHPTEPRISGELGTRAVALCEQIGARATRREPIQAHIPPLPQPPSLPDTLVLGGTGFIGKALVKRLVQAGRSVRLLVRDPHSLSADLRRLPLEVRRGDLADTAGLEDALAGIQDVFHLARGTGKTYDDFVRTDRVPTERLVQACVTHKIRRLIYTGTIASLDTSQPDEVILDDTPVDPRLERRAPYSRVKGESERLLLEMHRREGLPVVILRPGVVIGPGTSPFHWGVAYWPAPYVARLWGEGRNPLPLVLVDDVAEALVQAALKPQLEGKTYNLVAETDITAREYIAELARASGTWIDVKPRSMVRYHGSDLLKYGIKVLVRHPGRQRPDGRDWRSRANYARFDCRQARRDLDWNPCGDRATLIRQGIDDAVREWCR